MRLSRLVLSTLVAVSTFVVLGLEPGSSSEGTRSPRPLQFSGPLTFVCGVEYPGVTALTPEVCLLDSPITADHTPTHDLNWSLDGTRLAFERGGTIYIRSVWFRPGVDEHPWPGKLRRVVEGREPVWSPSGNHLAYARAESGSRDVYVVRDSGAGDRRLTRGTSDDYAPAWSPDGRTIAYTRGSTIRLVAFDGSHDRQLGGGRNPDWSADGKRLAFEHEGDVWVQDGDGSGRKNVTSTPDLRETSPSWSPDGQARIAYVGQSPSGDHGLYTLFIGGTPVRRYVEELRERPFFEPVVDWQPIRVLVPTVSARRPIVSLRDSRGNILRTVRPGCYAVGYVDRSNHHGIVIAGVGFPFIGLNPLDPAGRRTVRFVGRRWPSARHVSGCGWLGTGSYRYWDPAQPRLHGSFRVVDRP